ncbi:MAG TPA: cbb3-type cytochrome c oxidase N-terminal domain-containing protein [Verrucomicrobiae bacterium]|nr:cbb3-type cytochrome c oxidase N-terminal domain-containing protein [Verrucomicrobiae bacterium]
MNESKDPLLLDHDFDGIHELDNKLPRWWVYLFYGTILFAVLYLGYYHVYANIRPGKVKSSAEEYLAEMAIGNAIKSNAMASFEAGIAKLEPSKDPAVLADGKQTFLTLCAPCHRADAGGLVGPNLCDNYWIHGSNFSDNVTTIWNGVPAKGMVTWKNSLKPKQVFDVASYIYTLRGTHPVNPKPPENQAPVKTGPSEFE